MALVPWTRGKKYKVRYRTPTQRYDRELVAVYLGKPDYRSNVIDVSRRTRQFSGRPEFGTTELEIGWIIANEEVDPSTKCYVGRRAPERK